MHCGLQVPSGLLPAMELDGRLYVESAEIMRLLEEEFPDSAPLMPAASSPERGRADALMRLERRLFSDWLSWLCQSWWVPPAVPSGAGCSLALGA